MTTRTATAVIVKAVTLNHDDVERTVYYGPFLPHVGSATTSFAETLERELEESGRYKHWDTSIDVCVHRRRRIRLRDPRHTLRLRRARR